MRCAASFFERPTDTADNHKGFAVLSLTDSQVLRFAWNNLDKAAIVFDDAYALSQSESCVEGWTHIRHSGDILAPVADEALALFSARDAAEVDCEAVKRQILAHFESQSATRAGNRPLRDGKWLAAGMELLKIVLPVLLSRLGS